MSVVLAIDPGPAKSAWLVLGMDELDFGLVDNPAMFDAIQLYRVDAVAIETIEPWGGFVGPPALDTMRWVGRFEQAALPTAVALYRRSWVLSTLGIGRLPRGQAQAAVRAMLIDRWGGGNPVKRDHPLHGISGDIWSALALAVAVTSTDLHA